MVFIVHVMTFLFFLYRATPWRNVRTIIYRHRVRAIRLFYDHSLRFLISVTIYCMNFPYLISVYKYHHVVIVMGVRLCPVSYRYSNVFCCVFRAIRSCVNPSQRG